MRYVEARLSEQIREDAYRIYITRSLQLIPQNRYITMDFMDVLDTKNVDNRSGEDIAIDVIKGAGLSFEVKA